MERDDRRELLFAELAFAADLIDRAQYDEACARWSADPRCSMAELLANRVTGADRALLDAWADRRLARLDAAGDAAETSLSEGPEAPRGAGAVGHVLVETISVPAGAAERYTLSRLHARGGLGQVWLAKDVRIGREIAFKEIRPDLAHDASLWRRFLQEARITGQLEHPGIVPVYEVADRPDTGQPFYTMRFVRGRTLTQAIESWHERRARGEAGPLEQQALLGAFLGITNAIAYAHSNGVIHRDLKGDNVILGDFGEVIVLDWGIAKVLRPRAADSTPGTTTPAPEPDDETMVTGSSSESGETVAGHAIGTPAFMSPEQAEGRLADIDERSDVYGLGAILYSILTGKPPFSGGGVTDVLRRVKEEPPPRPRSIVEDVPPALEAVCLKALAKQPADRYPSASALAEEVRRFLADEPVDAWPEPFSRRASRWARRHRTFVTTAAALLVTAVVVLTAGTVLLGKKQREIEHQRALAEENFGLAREAVSRYFTRVADAPDLKAHGLESLRRKLLDTAREFYTRFVEQQGEHPELRADLADAQTNLGNISRDMGEYDRAEKALASAAETYAALARENPDNRAYRRSAAITDANLALLYGQTRRTELSEKASRRAIDTYGPLVEASPDDAVLVENYAAAIDNLGVMYDNANRFKDAEPQYRRALALREQNLAREPKNTYYAYRLAQSNVNLGGLLAKSGRVKEAEAPLEKAIALSEPLAKAEPDDPEPSHLLAAALGNLAGVYMLLDRMDDSAAMYRRELVPRERLARTHPLVLEYSLFLASAYTNLGELETRTRHYEAALPWLDKAILTMQDVLQREPRHTTARFYISYTYSWRAQAKEGLGRRADAVQDWDRAIEFDDRNDKSLREGRARAAR